MEEIHSIVSIYSQLLVAAFGSAQQVDGSQDVAQLVADLTSCRARLPEVESPLAASGGVPAAVADQLAYDLALTALCRHASVAFDVAEFDRPATARARLEQALSDKGYPTALGENLRG